MLSEAVLTTLGKAWKPILVVFGALVTYLYVYFKGRKDGKMKGDLMLKSAEIETHKTILKEKESNEKKSNEIDVTIDSMPDDFTS